MTYHGGNQLLDIPQILDASNLSAGMHVADLGCGRTGYVVFPLAKVIGAHGMVYAVDIMKDVLEEVHKRAALEGFAQVFTVWADLERPGAISIPEHTLDVVFLVNTLFHFSNVEPVLDEALRLMAPKSRLVVVDWTHNELPFGPKQEQLVDFARVDAWARTHHFTVQNRFAPGDHHQGVVYFKHDKLPE